MSLKAYFHGARAALDLARKCKRSADEYDDAWRAHMLAESKRHRQRAKWYLALAKDSRNWHRDMGSAA